jgi:ligand-binding SRPBCC domain-containing protein
MRILIKTRVQSDWQMVRKAFDESLLKRLSPPFPPARLVRYDGNSPGNLVEIELNFFFFKAYWVSIITDEQENKSSYSFTDEGHKLPFFLSRWKHIHKITKDSDGAIIIDDIEFGSGYLLSDLILYPGLWFQFIYRKPIYKRVFSTTPYKNSERDA